MKILINKDNIVLFMAERIELGIYDEPFEKWIIEDEEKGYKFYCIDDDFIVKEVDNTPEDFRDMKYCYTDEIGFYPNESYYEPISTEERMKKLDEENINLKKQLDMVQEVLDFLTMT